MPEEATHDINVIFWGMFKHPWLNFQGRAISKMSYSYALSVFKYYYYTKHGKLYFISVSVSWEWKLHSLHVQKCFLGCLVWVSSQCFGWLIFCCCQVGSRLVLQTAGLLMIVLGLFGKFSAVFITIPDPVIGGMFLVMFGMVAAVGISNLQVHLIAAIHFYFIFIFIILKLHVRVTSSK